MEKIMLPENKRFENTENKAFGTNIDVKVNYDKFVKKETRAYGAASA